MEWITVDSASFDTLAAANPTWPMVWVSMSGGADRLAVVGTATTAYQLWLIGSAEVSTWDTTYGTRAIQSGSRTDAQATLTLSGRAGVPFPEYGGALTIEGLDTQAPGTPASTTSMTLTLSTVSHIQGGELFLSAPVDGDLITIEVVDDQGAVVHTLANGLKWPSFLPSWNLRRTFQSVAEVMAGHGVKFSLTRGPGAATTCAMIAHVDVYA